MPIHAQCENRLRSFWVIVILHDSGANACQCISRWHILRPLKSCHSKLTNGRVANNTSITADVVATRVVLLGGRARVVIDVVVLEYRESEARTVNICARAVSVLRVFRASRPFEPHPAVLIPTPVKQFAINPAACCSTRKVLQS